VPVETVIRGEKGHEYNTRLQLRLINLFPSSVPLTPLHQPAIYFSGGTMKKSRAQFECAILVNGRTAWKGKRPVRVYRRIRARHPRAKISIRWTLKEGTLIANAEISLPYWA
jgi:hypothetical protein